MSLIFRSVKKISRKKRKTGNRTKSKKCFKDPFEDNPMKFTVEDEDNFSDFPTLNSIYKTDYFGTPVVFKNGYGSDCMKFLKIKTRLQSIVFMKEYVNKSFEELRWEDYQSNRKGSQIFEEKNYSKCLSKDAETPKWKTILPPKKYEFIEPIPKNVFGKFPALNKHNDIDVDMSKAEQTVTHKLLPKINEESANVTKDPYVRQFKERSILTNVDKFYQTNEKTIKEVDPCRKEININKCSSDGNIHKSKKEDMVKENLERYFSGAYTNASIPYDYCPQNNNYYLPCTNISLAYKNTKQAKISNKNQSGYFRDLLQTNPFGYDAIFDKLDPIFEKGTLYEKLFGAQSCKEDRDLHKIKLEKYSPDNLFSKKYFWTKFSPYSSSKKRVDLKLNRDERRAALGKYMKAKNFWLGLNVVA